MKKLYVFYFAAFIMLLASCSPSTHLGKTTYDKPSMSETDVSKWYSYYDDQLDAYRANVVPPLNGYPDAAQEGYKKARLHWEDKQKNARTNSYVLGLGLSIGFLLLTLMPLFNNK